eukprot:CAMPEP_0114694668 /NCGR_PEP_ID=MMETSP0191-20121206/70435_1 /TAXON_ID=126664 /ORGANISM="Sorites sp." /LENGTH=81 /DNA_ID=CAMNT_0001989835 /DNA_START=1 /DNA_END=244 /DNA_ORIENTATION=+
MGSNLGIMPPDRPGITCPQAGCLGPSKPPGIQVKSGRPSRRKSGRKGSPMGGMNDLGVLGVPDGPDRVFQAAGRADPPPLV